jgi:acyl-CoA reductase-like NAD-dependent aldehyde dehydrogenase
MSAKERGRLMFKLADLMERDAEELAQLETLVRLAPPVSHPCCH